MANRVAPFDWKFAGQSEQHQADLFPNNAEESNVYYNAQSACDTEDEEELTSAGVNALIAYRASGGYVLEDGTICNNAGKVLMSGFAGDFPDVIWEVAGVGDAKYHIRQLRQKTKRIPPKCNVKPDLGVFFIEFLGLIKSKSKIPQNPAQWQYQYTIFCSDEERKSVFMKWAQEQLDLRWPVLHPSDDEEEVGDTQAPPRKRKIAGGKTAAAEKTVPAEKTVATQKTRTATKVADEQIAQSQKQEPAAVSNK